MSRSWLFVFCLILPVACPARAEDPKLSSQRLLITTNLGPIVAALYPEVAPQHTQQILNLAAAGVFNGAAIFRVEKGFVAQIENYDARPEALTPAQKAAVKKIPAEFSALKHERGVLSMARFDDDINSGESSFSFLLGPAPHLDNQYTIFGRVTGGWETLTAIERAAVDAENRPVFPIRVEKVEVVVDGSKLDQSPPIRWAPFVVAALLVGILASIFLPSRKA